MHIYQIRGMPPVAVVRKSFRIEPGGILVRIIMDELIGK